MHPGGRVAPRGKRRTPGGEAHPKGRGTSQGERRTPRGEAHPRGRGAPRQERGTLRGEAHPRGESRCGLRAQGRAGEQSPGNAPGGHEAPGPPSSSVATSEGVTAGPAATGMFTPHPLRSSRGLEGRNRAPPCRRWAAAQGGPGLQRPCSQAPRGDSGHPAACVRLPGVLRSARPVQLNSRIWRE